MSMQNGRKVREVHIFGPKKVYSTKKVLCHAQNPNFQHSLGFYLDTVQILKVWSPLDKRISLHKFWAQNFSITCKAQKSKLAQKKQKSPADNPKDSRNTRVQLRKCNKDKICCPKVCDRQTNRQTFSDPSSTEVENTNINNYRIYSNERPGRSFNFGTLRRGAHSREALIKYIEKTLK